MKKIYWILFLLLLVYSLYTNYIQSPQNLSEEKYIENTLQHLGYPSYAAGDSFTPVTGEAYLPIKNFYRNQTVNVFGTYVKGRFVGFHTGVDVEIDWADSLADVPVYAIYNGEVNKVEFATGYGGVVIINHNFAGRPVWGVYGHLRLRDIKVKSGDKVTPGQLIGYLGQGYSGETDGERKHLHLSLYNGAIPDIRGYVDTSPELANWFNPTEFLKKLGAREVK